MRASWILPWWDGRWVWIEGLGEDYEVKCENVEFDMVPSHDELPTFVIVFLLANKELNA